MTALLRLKILLHNIERGRQVLYAGKSGGYTRALRATGGGLLEYGWRFEIVGSENQTVVKQNYTVVGKTVYGICMDPRNRGWQNRCQGIAVPIMLYGRNLSIKTWVV